MKSIIAVIALWALLVLGFWGGVAYVVLHFILKWW